jgi:hypothetical protein
MLFAMPNGSTASDLCQEIKSVTGSSVRLYNQRSGGFGSEMEDTEDLFSESNLNNIRGVPSFEIFNQKQEFQIFVETLTRSIITLSVRRSTIAFNICLKLQDITGIPRSKLRLLYEARAICKPYHKMYSVPSNEYLTDGKLAEYNIGPVSPLYIVLPR